MDMPLDLDLLDKALETATTTELTKPIYPHASRLLLQLIDCEGNYYEELRQEIKPHAYWESEELHCQRIVNLIAEWTLRTEMTKIDDIKCIKSIKIPPKNEMFNLLQQADAQPCHINRCDALRLAGESQSGDGEHAFLKLCRILLATTKPESQAYEFEFYEQLRRRNADSHYWETENIHCLKIWNRIRDWNYLQRDDSLQQTDVSIVPPRKELLHLVRQGEGSCE